MTTRIVGIGGTVHPGSSTEQAMRLAGAAAEAAGAHVTMFGGDYLRALPPFNTWNLPPADETAFAVVRTKSVYGKAWDLGNRHQIDISATYIGRTKALLETMAHEMIHLFLHENKHAGRGEHSEAFKKMRKNCSG